MSGHLANHLLLQSVLQSDAYKFFVFRGGKGKKGGISWKSFYLFVLGGRPYSGQGYGNVSSEWRLSVKSSVDFLKGAIRGYKGL